MENKSDKYLELADPKGAEKLCKYAAVLALIYFISMVAPGAILLLVGASMWMASASLALGIVLVFKGKVATRIWDYDTGRKSSNVLGGCFIAICAVSGVFDLLAESQKGTLQCMNYQVYNTTALIDSFASMLVGVAFVESILVFLSIFFYGSLFRRPNKKSLVD